MCVYVNDKLNQQDYQRRIYVFCTLSRILHMEKLLSDCKVSLRNIGLCDSSSMQSNLNVNVLHTTEKDVRISGILVGNING
jgi:hypothetical protein